MRFNQKKLGGIKDVLREQVERGRIAGANALIWQGGEEQFYCETGYADLENKKPIQRDTIFRLYSMSKPVTGAACMLLAERGAIDLLDPVSRYLPGFRDQKVATSEGPVPVKREMTIQDLLGMTSGLVYSGAETWAGRDMDKVWQAIARCQSEGNDMTTMKIADMIGKCNLAFHPGERWHYGTSADIAGAVVEAASGKSFGEFLANEFFVPLGMNDTGFYVPEDKRSRLARSYRETEHGLELYTGNHLGICNAMDRPGLFESGGAGLVSTIDDYLMFARMLLGGGCLNGTRILSPETVKSFTSVQLTCEQRKCMDEWNHGLSGYSYGRFMRILTDPGQAMVIGSLGEYGWDGWLGVYFANFPELDATFLLMFQRADSGTMEFTRRARNIMMGAIE